MFAHAGCDRTVALVDWKRFGVPVAYLALQRWSADVERAIAAHLTLRLLGQIVGWRIHSIADHERHHRGGEAEATPPACQPNPVAVAAEAVAKAAVLETRWRLVGHAHILPPMTRCVVVFLRYPIGKIDCGAAQYAWIWSHAVSMLPHFKTAALNHSATHPRARLYRRKGRTATGGGCVACPVRCDLRHAASNVFQPIIISVPTIMGVGVSARTTFWTNPALYLL